MSTLRHHQLGLLFILLSVVGLLVLTRTQTLASADPRDASFPTVTPTATLPPSEEDWEVAESFDSPLPTPIPTVMPELSRFGRIALHYLAEQRGVASETLLIEQEHPRSYPLLEREFMAFTILDTNDGQAFVLLVDTATDEVVDDLATMEQANGEAHFARYGKLDPALYERLQTVDETTQLPVALWVVSDYGDIEEKLHSELASKYPEVAEALARNASPFDVADAARSDELRKEWAELLQRELDAALIPLMVDLETEGIAVEKPGHLPALTAMLTKPQVLALAERDDVQLLYLVEGEGEPALDTATPTNRIGPVWISSGMNGAGRTIAIVEDGNVDHDNNHLNVSSTQRAGCSGENEHATLVASAAASTHPTHRGMAFGASILSAGVNPCTNPEIYNSLNWALDNGAHVVNLSYGVNSNTSALEWNDVALDYAARSRSATIVVAAGNWRNRHIYSPGKAWNVITVGGTNNQGTVIWNDDQMYLGPQANEGSAYLNPSGGSQGDREKPEVVAVAQYISGIGPNNVLIPDNQTDLDQRRRGTSFAAPQVSGLAAVMMQRNGEVYNYPLAVKAIIMATAVHNIEGDRRLSDQDGAGSIDAALADYVVQTQAEDGVECGKPCWWAFNTTSNNPAVGGDKVQTFRASRGERIRVAIAWWSAAGTPLPHPAIGVDALGVNFDLRVYRQSNNVTPVASSTSVDNNFEIVDFIAPETGAYTIRVRKQSATENDNALGIAWVKLATYLLEVRRNSGGWTSTIYVRNDGPTNWQGKVTFFDQAGNYAGESNMPNLAPNAVWSGATPPNNWVGTAVVSGSDDISVVIRNDKTGLATFDNGLTPGGATDPAWGLAGAVIHAPALYNNIFGGYSSTLYVQNPNATLTTLTPYLYGRTGYNDYPQSDIYMGAGNQQVLSLGPMVNNTSWAGSLYGTATQPVAFRIYEEKGSTESRSYNATAVGRHLIYVPAAYRNYYGFNSGLVIQNLHNSSSANVTLRYCERTVTNPATCPTQSVSIPARRAVGVNLNNAPVPNGWSGTVSLQSQSSSIPIAAVVNNTNSVGGYAFNATGYGSKLAIFPRAAKNANGRSTGFTVRNVSGTTIQIIPRYYSADGVQIWWGDALQNTQGQPITLQSAQAIGYFQATDCLPAGLCLPNDWQGSIVLEATGDIVAVMREDTSSTTSGYNGVSR